MDMIETHPLVILLVALLTPLLTYAISKAGVVGERLRPILPIIATGLAIGLVSAGLHWMEGGGGDGSTMEKVWNGLFAGALAVLAWSQGREGKKAVDGQGKGPGAAARTGVVLVGLMLLVGCGGQTSYLPILQSSLTASQALTRGAQTQAVESGSLTACLASGALSDAFSSASDALDAWAQAEPDTYTLPGFKVDVSPCGSLSEGFEPLLREEAAQKVRSYTEGLAPLALTVTRAAVASAGMDCRDQLLVLAVLGYLEGALRPVVDELTSPDGVVEIPAVELNLARCG